MAGAERLFLVSENQTVAQLSALKCHCWKGSSAIIPKPLLQTDCNTFEGKILPPILSFCLISHIACDQICLIYSTTLLCFGHFDKHLCL